MEISASVVGSLSDELNKLGSLVREAANEAVVETAGEVAVTGRLVIAEGMGNRVGNLWGLHKKQPFYTNESTGAVAAYLHSRWFRGAEGGAKTFGSDTNAKGGLRNVNDVLAFWGAGGDIVTVKGKGFLFVPVAPGGTSGRAWSVSAVARRRDLDSKFIKLIPTTFRNGKRGFTVVDFRGIAKRRRRTTGRGLEAIKQNEQGTKIGYLIPSPIRFGAKFDFDAIPEFAAARLGARLAASFAARGLDLS